MDLVSEIGKPTKNIRNSLLEKILTIIESINENSIEKPESVGKESDKEEKDGTVEYGGIEDEKKT